MLKKSISLVGFLVLTSLLLTGCKLNTGTSSIPSSTSSGNGSVSMEEPSGSAALESEVGVVSPSYRVGAMEAFDKAKFEAALADGKKVFLDFYASWCPTCRANEPLVDAYFDGEVDVVGFRVDYDNETDLKKEYAVTTQSTYLVLEGGEEKDRYLGSLTQEKLENLID